MFSFPEAKPLEDRVHVWTLQKLILSEAEVRFGPMNPAKKLFRPEFVKNGPHVINTPSFDGGFAGLSMNAASYWPAFIWELSHETVHLLDPDVAGAPYLEEGFCDFFAIEMAAPIHGVPSSRPNAYVEAERLVRSAFNSPYDAARQIRERFGRLRDATTQGMCELFPDIPLEVIHALLRRHEGRMVHISPSVSSSP